jgi:hypothetical protein
MWKVRSCSNTTTAIISCGRRVGGPALITVWPMPWRIHRSGPFNRVGKILEQNPAIATGAGHHSVLHPPGSDQWYIVYHRRPLNQTDRNAREVCIDKMEFDEQGMIKPVVITIEGVLPHGGGRVSA